MSAYDASASSLTDNTVLGPFHATGARDRDFGESMLDDPDDGDRVVVRGTITDVDKRVEGVVLDCWQNASNMFYAVQQPGIQSESTSARHLPLAA